MVEMDKLEEYLIEHNLPYKRYDDEYGLHGRHQIFVYGKMGQRLWDAICQVGSYGYSKGLIEIAGSLVDKKKDGDTVVGFLTADDVIRRIETN